MQYSPDSNGSKIKQTAKAVLQTIKASAAETKKAAHTARRRLVPALQGILGKISAFFQRAGEVAAEALVHLARAVNRAVSGWRKWFDGHIRRASVRRRARGAGPLKLPRFGKKTAVYAAIFLAAIASYAAAILFSAGTSPSEAAGPAPAESIEGFRGQTEGAEQIPIANAFRGLMDSSRESLSTLRDQMKDSLTEEYLRILDRGEGDSFQTSSKAGWKLFNEVREQRRKELQEDPYLILVNKWHTLPEDYEVVPVELQNGQSISGVCSEKLEQMLDDCAEAGGTPIVCSGYRPHWHQVDLFDAQVNRWLYAGYGQEDAEMYAATAVAIPGTSEHELGLAADIYSSENMDLDESQIYTFTQQWLMENCWQYGFILRYPQDKSEITGIIFEPWHYRYVGKKHAKKIHEAGICLEEYLDQTDHRD